MKSINIKNVKNYNNKFYKYKTTICLAITFFIILIFNINIFAVTDDVDNNQTENINNISIDDIYQKQLEESNANNIYYSLPQETKNYLNKLGITSVSFSELNSLSFGAVLNALLQMFSENSTTPLSAVAQVIGIILLCALVDSMKTTLNDKPLGGIVSIIGTLCVSCVLVFPITKCIVTASNIIQTSANFMILFVPILTGVLVASGNALTGATYYNVMMVTAQSVTLTSANIIVPFMNVFLSLSIVGAVTSKINLDGVCDLFAKLTKWILTFVMSIFVSVLSFQTIISAVADKTSVRATRFAISSVVPLVGGALSDAFLTVQSCITMLKSGVGVFVIISAFFIFLPIIFECIIWIFTLNICSAIGQMFNISIICKILNNSSKVVTTLLAVLLCFLAVFIISSTLILIVRSS